MTLPSTASHDGWVMESTTQIDESAVAEAIDLGLSVEWASWNVGATAPEECGGYYAWGEIEMKSNDDYENLDIGENISGTEYDVANVKWGDGWRMPTLEEFKELCTGCSWEWTSFNNVYGQKVTGPNGNSIFLPAAGIEGGYYWSASLFQGFSSYAHYFCFSSGVDGAYYEVFSRSNCCSIRPVRNKKVEDEPSAPVVEKVDLGLSVKWASCNVGAESPEDYGDYFAWSETTTKSSYSSSLLSDVLDNSISGLKSLGIIDANGNLTAAYDAATSNWGDEWRMPTSDEIKELVNNCTWRWTTQNGVYGYKVVGPNGNSIFLPAAGNRDGTEVYGRGSLGYYWSATPRGEYIWVYSLVLSNSSYSNNTNFDFYGFSVRPVYGPARPSISVTTGDATAITDCGATLSGIVSNSDEPVTCGIIYDISSTLSSTSGTMLSTSSSGEFSIEVTGLSPKITYYYCAYVEVDGEYKYGEVRSFTTEAMSIPAGEAIDLGLSVKWASCNVGAKSPEDYGDYFAWGETTT